MQALDLLGLQRDRHVAPAEANVGMMPFSLREIGDVLHEGERCDKFLNLSRCAAFVKDAPLRRLMLMRSDLLRREWRDTPTTGCAGLGRQG